MWFNFFLIKKKRQKLLLVCFGSIHSWSLKDWSSIMPRNFIIVGSLKFLNCIVKYLYFKEFTIYISFIEDLLKLRFSISDLYQQLLDFNSVFLGYWQNVRIKKKLTFKCGCLVSWNPRKQDCLREKIKKEKKNMIHYSKKKCWFILISLNCGQNMIYYSKKILFYLNYYVPSETVL